MDMNGAPCGGRKLGLTMQLTNTHGWGVHGLYLAKRLLEREVACPVQLHQSSPNLHLSAHERALLAPFFAESVRARSRLASGRNVRVAFPAFHSLGNRPAFAATLATVARGPRDTACVVLESPFLDTSDSDHLRSYGRVMTVSGWNHDVLAAHNVPSRWLSLGVDTDLFCPSPTRDNRFGDGRFVVFSGGKAEFRKGQDIVLAAFKKFHSRHPDSVLVAAWHNLWPPTAASLSNSPHGFGAPGLAESGSLDITRWAMRAGLVPGSFVDVGMVSNRVLAKILAGVDAALYPNRCEGGTNMVAMECLAAGVPTILSDNSGHLDLTASVPCIALTRQGRPKTRDFGDHGGESSVDEAVEALDVLYRDRDAARELGLRAAAVMRADWQWSTRLDWQIDLIGEAAGWSLPLLKPIPASTEAASPTP